MMGLRKLFFRLFLLSVPLLGIITFYILTDPYSIIFANDWPLRKIRLESSRDYAMTEQFLQVFPEKKYNSFIFGNSKSYFYDENEWRKYIGSDQRTYCWGAPGESFYNIRRKLEIIVENGGQVNNALLILDFRIINNTRNNGAEFQNPGSMHHPQTSTKGYFRFEQQYFTYYLSDFMFVRHMDYTLTGKYKPYMEGYVPDAEEQLVLGVNNQAVRDWDLHKRNGSDSLNQSAVKTDTSLLRPGVYQDSTLEEDDLEDLTAIVGIFKSQKTNYKIICGPLLDGSGMNPENVNLLNSIFGASNVFDFSQDTAFAGKPRYFMDDKVHYIVPVAGKILERVYRQ